MHTTKDCATKEKSTRVVTHLLQEAPSHLLRQNPATANEPGQVSTRTPLQDQINVVRIPLREDKNSNPLEQDQPRPGLLTRVLTTVILSIMCAHLEIFELNDMRVPYGLEDFNLCEQVLRRRLV